MKRNLKWIAIALAAALVLGAGGGVWYYLGHNSADPVYVYRFDFVGMTEYWGDSRESYGPVSTDRIQTVYVSETQEITEILVSQGDTVKKGDLLMTFDTTLSDLAVERKALEVDKVTLELEDAVARLQQINWMKPMTEPPEPDESKIDYGYQLKDTYKTFVRADHDGSSPATAPVIWVRNDTAINDAFMAKVKARILERREEIRKEQEAKGETTAPTEESEAAPTDNIYFIIKITNKNMSAGATATWLGIFLKDSGFRFFDAGSFEDYTYQEAVSTEPEVDWMGSGYTAAQINQMRIEQQKTIKDLEFKLKMTEAEYSIMQKELSDGNVYADTDGVVISLIDENEAKMMGTPIMKVSGGGGFYVEGSFSELERDEMQIGQEVTINDWQSGGMYTGSITEIRDFPNGESGSYGMGNPNSTRYPFVVFVDESADLREGSYVSIQYTPEAQQNGIYLQKPFLRTEGGRSFVYVMGENGRLEERTVTTGKSLWGSYTEIVDGLTVDDLIAFPYGKGVRPGAKAAEGDLSNLYGY